MRSRTARGSRAHLLFGLHYSPMDQRLSAWEVETKSGLVSIGTHQLYAAIRGPLRLPVEPVVIIFPGAGAACDTWIPVSTKIASFARVLLYDRAGLGHSERGLERQNGSAGALELSELLKAIEVKGPYVLVAHSYGGCIAREFLQCHSRDVVGMVLSETGTETVCEHSEEQYKLQILGDAPLVVIRGQAAFKQSLENMAKTTQNEDSSHEADHTRLLQYQMFENMAKTDENLKREQLRLSRQNKFRNVPNCGHSIHLDRPEVVVEEVRWVLDNLRSGSTVSVAPPCTLAQSGIVSRLYNKLLIATSKR